MKCNNCKNEISDESKFCSHCGSKIELQNKICPNKVCGKTGLPKEALFCPDCGAQLDMSVGTEKVDFTVAFIKDQKRKFYFEYQPSKKVFISKLSITSPITQNFFPNELINTKELMYSGPVTGAETGEVWQFLIHGNISSSRGQEFDVNVSCVIPPRKEIGVIKESIDL